MSRAATRQITTHGQEAPQFFQVSTHGLQPLAAEDTDPNSSDRCDGVFSTACGGKVMYAILVNQE